MEWTSAARVEIILIPEAQNKSSPRRRSNTSWGTPTRPSLIATAPLLLMNASRENVPTTISISWRFASGGHARAVVEECIRFRKLSDHYPKFRMEAGQSLLHNS